MSERVLRALLLSTALCVGAWTRDASATTVVPTTVEALSQRADVVVVATVRATRSLWEGRLIVTDAELEVRVSMKGAFAPGATLVLRVPGGVVGDVGQVVPGVARLDVGDTVVAFLTRAEDRSPGRFYLTHLTASILPVRSTSAAASPSTTLVVRPAVEGMTVVEPTNPTAGGSVAPSPRAAPRTVMPREGLTLDRLMTLVRTAR